MKIGLGITTYNRPGYLAQCIEGVKKHLLPEIDVCYVYNDGSDKGNKEYRQLYKSLPEGISYRHNPKNKGVACAKNWLLKRMLEDGCDYLFLLEDDIVPQSPKAITEYIRLSDESGIEHMMFAHHGPANIGKLYLREKGIDLYTACVGAYTFYTARIVREVGYMDESFVNAWEHIEHTFRIQKAGLTSPYPTYADLTNSRKYLQEIPDSIEGSSIRPKKDWALNLVAGLMHWKDKDADFPYNEKLESLLQEVQP